MSLYFNGTNLEYSAKVKSKAILGDLKDLGFKSRRELQ